MGSIWARLGRRRFPCAFGPVEGTVLWLLLGTWEPSWTWGWGTPPLGCPCAYRGSSTEYAFICALRGAPFCFLYASVCCCCCICCCIRLSWACFRAALCARACCSCSNSCCCCNCSLCRCCSNCCCCCWSAKARSFS